MRERKVLLGTEGPSHNVLKIRPPMPFCGQDVDRFVTALDEVLGLATKVVRNG
jgi:4-aminobutyrate aminotransferase-like enzyme